MIDGVNIATNDSLTVVVRQQGADSTIQFIGRDARRSKPIPSKPENLSSRPHELIIEFDRQGIGLGLSIAGGCDTILGAVFIHNVLAGGSAALDGRLRSADRVIQINGVDFEVIERCKALDFLRKLPDKVRICVCRDRVQVCDVTVLKEPGCRLGLSIVHSRTANGIYISAIAKYGAAERSGQLKIGDQLLEVNGIDLCHADQPGLLILEDEAVTVLKNARGLLHLRIARRENIERRYSETIQQSSSLPFFPERVVTQRPKYRTVTLERNRRGLGFSIIGGACHLKGDLPVIVRSISPYGPAQQCAAIYPGDEILAIDAIPVVGLTHYEVVDLLKSTADAVTLTLTSWSAE